MRFVMIVSSLVLTHCLIIEANAVELRGVIFSEAGIPAPGATITAAAVFRSPPWRVTTQSDDQGGFKIMLPAANDHEFYYLAVRWNSQGSDVMNGVDKDGKSVTLKGQSLPSLTIRLRSEGRLRGKLLQEEDKKPIDGGKLYLNTGEVLTTDADGKFEVNGLPMRDHSLILVAPGRVRQYVLFDTTLRPDAELELWLQRGTVLKGIVADESGNPIPTAYVHRSSSGTALTLNGWDEACGPDGSFVYGGLSTNRLFYGLEVSAPGYQQQEVRVEAKNPDDVIEQKIILRKTAKSFKAKYQKESTKEQTDELTVELPRRTVEGTVRDENGRPVKGATIRWGAFLWDPSVKPTKSDDTGRYRLDRVPDERGAILVIADGLAPQFVPVAKSKNQVNIEMVRGSIVRGVVLGNTGIPIAGVRVIPITHCQQTGFCNPIWLSELETETNERGEFTIPSMPSVGASFDILKAGYSERRNVDLKPGDTIHKIELSAGGAVTGKVVNADGQPVRQFNIRVRFPRARQQTDQSGGFYAGFGWYGISFTRDDGTFVLTDIGAGNWLRMVVTSPGVGIAIIDRVQSDSLDQLPAADGLKFELVPFFPLNVHVEEFSTGEPVAGATVGLMEDDIDHRRHFNWGHDDLWLSRTRSNEHGIATFKEPGSEDGLIVVSAPGFARQRVEWIERAKQVTVTLRPEARLEGEVRLNGALVKEGYIRLKTKDNETFTIDLEGADGRFRIDRLPAGEYMMEFSNQNGQSLHTAHLTLEAGMTQREIVELPTAKR